MEKSSIEIVDSPEAMIQSVSNGQAQIALTNPLLGSILVKQLVSKMEQVGPFLLNLDSIIISIKIMLNWFRSLIKKLLS